MNTKINYLYRDAGNYKVFQSQVLSGEITEEQKNTILTHCFPGDYFFIPSRVGLSETRFDSWSVDDLDWFELEGFELTEEEPDCDITVSELTENFLKAKFSDV